MGIHKTKPFNLNHDDIFSLGEQLCSSTEQIVRNKLHSSFIDKRLVKKSITLNNFPGSHPVAIVRGNLPLLNKRDFMVTWKADGTRYIMLIEQAKIYLIDRKMDVVEVPAQSLGFVYPNNRQKNKN